MFDEKQAEAYVQKILTGKIEPETDEERGVLQRLTRVTEEIDKTRQEGATVAGRMQELQTLTNRLAGKREAYLEILINIEVRRRVTSQPEKPVSLEDFREKVGADAVEAYDSRGDLIETTEEKTDDADDRKPGRAGPEASGKPQSS
jgi:hypothetical protein